MTIDRPTNYKRTSEKIAQNILDDKINSIKGTHIKSQKIADKIVSDKKLQKIINNNDLQYDGKLENVIKNEKCPK